MNSIIIVKKNKKLIYKYYKIKINLQTWVSFEYFIHKYIRATINI